MFRWVGGLMDRGCAVIGAILFAQAPLFMQEYTQQLVGRAAEVNLQIQAMRSAASLSGKTLEQLMQKFLENPDQDVMRQGEVMLSLVNRGHDLSQALSAMEGSAVWERPFAFIYHMNADAFSSTFQQFKIGLPLNMEGGIYALLGVVCGYLVFAFVRKIFHKIGGLFLKNDTRTPIKSAKV